MPDYTVTVTKKQTVREDFTVTAANETAARVEAIKQARTYVNQKGTASYKVEVETITPVS